MITINFCGSELYILRFCGFAVLRFCGLFSSSFSEKWFVHLELNNPTPQPLFPLSPGKLNLKHKHKAFTFQPPIP